MVTLDVLCGVPAEVKIIISACVMLTMTLTTDT